MRRSTPSYFSHHGHWSDKFDTKECENSLSEGKQDCHVYQAFQRLPTQSEASNSESGFSLASDFPYSLPDDNEHTRAGLSSSFAQLTSAYLKSRPLHHDNTLSKSETERKDLMKGSITSVMINVDMLHHPMLA